MAEIVSMADGRNLAAQAAQIGIKMGRMNQQREQVERENAHMRRRIAVLEARLECADDEIKRNINEKAQRRERELRNAEAEKAYRKTVFFVGFILGFVASGIVATVAMAMAYLR